MISAEEALILADKEAKSLGWGVVAADDFEAKLFVDDGQPQWIVRPQQIMLGKRVTFVIDAESGLVLERNHVGPR